METLAWSDTPDLLTLKATWPERYPAFFRTGGADGWDILFAFPQQVKTLSSVDDDHAASAFFNALPALAGQGEVSHLPFTGGWLLMLSYELGGLLEPVLSKTMAGKTAGVADFPLAWAMRIPAAILLDRQAGKMWLMAEDGNAHLIRKMQDDLCKSPQMPDADLPAYALSEDAPTQFLHGVERIKTYIREGDVFQVNLSRGWRADFADRISPSGLFERLNQSNPAPFSAVLEMGDWAIVSSSPERLVRVEQGGRVVTRPIAGTHPRSANASDDARLRESLATHPKERAEHIMLVDLERNDLGRVCKPGSVQVEGLMDVASYAHVHHLESSITGQLRPDISLQALIRAIFPGGTITGCPKVRTMQIIQELEAEPRLAYTGSLGYVNLDGTLDMNILIRSFLLKHNMAWFRTGSGIVADSEPQRELDETRAKAKGLLNALAKDAE